MTAMGCPLEGAIEVTASTEFLPLPPSARLRLLRRESVGLQAGILVALAVALAVVAASVHRLPAAAVVSAAVATLCLLSVVSGHGRVTIRASQDGLTVRRGKSERHYAWEAVRRVERGSSEAVLRLSGIDLFIAFAEPCGARLVDAAELITQARRSGRDLTLPRLANAKSISIPHASSRLTEAAISKGVVASDELAGHQLGSNGEAPDDR